MICPCCRHIGSQITKTFKMKGRAIIRCRVCFGCGGRFVTEGFSKERLRLVIIKTENHYSRRKFSSAHQTFINTKSFSVIVGGADKCSGKKI